MDEPRRVPATTSLYGAIADLGFTAGPAMAAAFLLFVGSAEAITAVNAVSFGASAVVLAFLRFGAAPEPVGDPELRRSLAREAREGVRAVSRLSGIRAILVASSAALFCAGLFNVGELFFATEDLKASEAGFSVLVALFGVGFIVGSLSGSAGRHIARAQAVIPDRAGRDGLAACSPRAWRRSSGWRWPRSRWRGSATASCWSTSGC